MKFGPVAVDRAAGSVLAHSVRIGPVRLRKGQVLTAQQCAALGAAGLREIVVARLEAGDLDENAAATALAAALVPDPAAAGLRPTGAFTGRVNLIAEAPGLARIDAAAIDRANRVHPMITVATAPRWQRMQHDGMVATVKIISYAVPGTALARACDAARGALALQRPVLRRAGFIETLVPGAEAAAAKGHLMMQARLRRLDAELAPPVTVAHRIAPLARAIAECREELVLILTGSATSDPADIAPEAVRRAGGRIVHFGMPVDPGNLLFLGEIGARKVIGLPGSARSPAVSGVDRIVDRIVCGVPVGPDDIMAMGVGGLLKEIPSRPQPRRQPR
ncbi:molybdopterin-binding protein [Sedimentitalea sp. HM32M-2]|uniref:molybdopterin-binding protein n=1 Tax=Sedimentitalea sp. HM32M-2 TaxID=3351566 RepID=UPI00364390B5